MTLRVIGPYRIDAEVRRVGVFVTYRATHRETERAAFVTTLHESIAPAPRHHERLLRAAKVLSRLGFVDVLGLLETFDVDGRLAVATVAPEGPSVRDVINEVRRARTARVTHAGLPRRGIEPVEAAAVGWALARAVDALHSAGFLHLALAPENAFLQRDGTIALGGFWDARALNIEASPDERDVPEPGPEELYRSPERVAGKRIDKTSDVYSIGLILYELLLGEHPFQGKTARHDEPPPLDVAQPIEHVLRKSVQRMAPLRHESAGKLAEDLSAALGDGIERGGAAVYDHLTGGSRQLTPPRDLADDRLRWLAVRLAIMGFVIVAVASGFAIADRGADRARQPGQGTASARVRVLAHPWADVYVDDVQIDTTPIGEPLRLSPGRHEITLRHPSAPDVRRVVELDPGELVTVDVDMDVARPKPSAEPPSP
ncbi:MAG: protein kinase [Polyangiaceae bacterium]